MLGLSRHHASWKILDPYHFSSDLNTRRLIRVQALVRVQNGGKIIRNSS